MAIEEKRGGNLVKVTWKVNEGNFILHFAENSRPKGKLGKETRINKEQRKKMERGKEKNDKEKKERESGGEEKRKEKWASSGKWWWWLQSSVAGALHYGLKTNGLQQKNGPIPI
ncbi:hypothetical protein Salat_2547500 [Sesamum alatum]|uniref:Uncharacterized protein n=1 Tax=Sesamum alatum TaxID=300844 RepID=A0AAE1XSG5_9LAMI|nr:hypothetical protein Salat_2547500 [Sesamum alatum]